jgi:selenocysteine-specific elongation factor
MLTVKLRLISYLQHPLRHGATVGLHTGAAETTAKVRLLEGDELRPGGVTWAQLTMERPVAVVKGDHYIIRSPMETLGGGIIVEAVAGRLRRCRPEVIRNLEAREGGSGAEKIAALLASRQPREFKTLVKESNLNADEAAALVDDLVQQGSAVAVGEGERRLLFTAVGWQSLAEKVAKTLGEYHRRFPARPGMPKLELSNQLKLGSHAPAALDYLAGQGVIAAAGGQVRLPSHAVSLSQAQQAKVADFLEALAQNPYAPPADAIPEPDLLGLLVGQGKVVKISDTIVFATSAYDEMVDKIKARIEAAGRINLGEVRDMFGTSRKYAQALLEHLDGKKVTRRVGDDRVLY